MKLRHMSATVDYVDSITLKLEDGENIHLENAYVLTSYASRVAVFCKMRCYLLPHYDCSVTIWLCGSNTILMPNWLRVRSGHFTS